LRLKRLLAVLVLVAITVAIVAPVVAPTTAYAATGGATSDLPPIPWPQVWQAIKNFGPMLIYLLDAAITIMTGGGTPPPNPPPPPPPPAGAGYEAPYTSGAGELAWCGGLAAAMGRA